MIDKETIHTFFMNRMTWQWNGHKVSFQGIGSDTSLDGFWSLGNNYNHYYSDYKCYGKFLATLANLRLSGENWLEDRF